MRLTPAFSAYLDALRFGAALAVLMGHMQQHGYDIGWIPLAHLGHEAVLIFFVMSGLIIASVTTGSGKDWRAYAVARTARIYSVALPAVILSVGLAALTLAMDPAFATSLTFFRAPGWIDTISSALFLNESWGESLGLSTKLTLNYPYWSLCYEVWYYVLFGVFLFGPARQRWWWLAALAVVAGPSVLVMLPIWGIGAWLGMQASRPVGPSWHWSVGFLAAPVAIALFEWFSVDLAVRDAIKARFPAWWHLGSSQRVFTDLILGALIGWHLSAFQRLPVRYSGFFTRRAGVLASAAGFSFTLYLFHVPILTLAGAMTPAAYKGPLASVLWAALFIGLCWLISFATERQLPRWRRAISPLVNAR